MIFRFFILLIIIFFISLGIDYIFLIFEKEGFIQIGSFIHILANGMLIFIPISALKDKGFYSCLPFVLISSFVVFAPIVIMKYNYVVLLSIAVYSVFAIYIVCKKTKDIGEKWEKNLKKKL